MLTSDQALEKMQALYRKLVARRPEVERFDGYYEGDQPLRFASQEWSAFHQNRYRGFADNWCVVVADAVNERLKVTGLRVGDKPTSEEKTLWNDWQRNNMPAQSSQGFLESIVAKRSAVIVWADEDDEPEVSWEHPSQVFVEYDPSNRRRRLFAIKAWVDGDTEYATLYEPDALWKYQRPYSGVDVRDGVTAGGLTVVGSYAPATDPSGWVPREVPDEVWPLPNPLGEVPVVEIENRPRLSREPLSDIAGAMSMQDAINLLWAYLFAAADHASMPARVVMGQEPPKMPVLDEKGQKVGEKTVDIKELQHGRLLWLTGQNTSIGQWDSAKLDVFTSVIEHAIGHLGGQTRTPAHYFVANKGLSNINGETLVATETPLVKKVEEFHLFAGGEVADVFRLMARVRGWDGLARSITAGATQWANAGIRSEAQLADSLLKKRQIGYPFEYLMEVDGIDREDRERIMKMREREMADPYFDRVPVPGDVNGGGDDSAGGA